MAGTYRLTASRHECSTGLAIWLVGASARHVFRKRPRPMIVILAILPAAIGLCAYVFAAAAGLGQTGCWIAGGAGAVLMLVGMLAD